MDHFAALRALRAIVDAGSFTAAAERLGTTHSAMSRQLRQLEEHLQVRLEGPPRYGVLRRLAPHRVRPAVKPHRRANQSCACVWPAMELSSSIRATRRSI